MFSRTCPPQEERRKDRKVKNMKAIIMLVHGSKDPAWNKPFIDLKDEVCRLIPDTVVTLACLQLGSPSLDEVASELQAEGVTTAVVVPVFLSGLGHVAKDIPVLVEKVCGSHPGLSLSVSNAIGEFPEVRKAIINSIAGLKKD